MFKKRQQKTKKAHRIDTLIGENTHLKGDIHFSGGLRIDGTVTGNIIAEEGAPAMLTLSEKGQINGEIRVPHQLINGQINGHVFASEHVELAAAARINGNLYYRLLEMTKGATVNGQLVRADEKDDTPSINLESGSEMSEPLSISGKSNLD